MKTFIIVHMVSLLCVLMFYDAGQSAEFFANGHITVNDNKLVVKDSAAYWDTEDRLLIFFYPFRLTEEDIKNRETGFSVNFIASPNRPAPDPEKWDYCPYGMLEVSFSEKTEEKKKENISLTIFALFGFIENYITINFSRCGREAVEFIDSIRTGRDNGHDFVEISIEGSDELSNAKCLWKLKSRTRIYAGNR